MTDMQLRSLPRTKMLEILYQQEREIERLTDELKQIKESPLPQPAVAQAAPAQTAAKSGGTADMFKQIVQSAQDEAQRAYEERKEAEEQQKRVLEERMEEARTVIAEAQAQLEDATASAKEVLDAMSETFELQVYRLNNIFAEYQDQSRGADIIPIDSHQEKIRYIT